MSGFKWLHTSHEGHGLRTSSYGSRYTGLHLMLLSARDGRRVWIWALFGWALTIGPADPVAEGRFSVREAHPNARSRVWSLRNGKVLELSHVPRSTTPKEGTP